MRGKSKNYPSNKHLQFYILFLIIIGAISVFYFLNPIQKSNKEISYPLPSPNISIPPNFYSDGNIEIQLPSTEFSIKKHDLQTYRLKSNTTNATIAIDIQPLIEDTSETYIQKRKAIAVGLNLYRYENKEYIGFVYPISMGVVALIYTEDKSLTKELTQIATTFKYLGTLK